MTENAGKSAIRGAELEAEYLATDTTLVGADVQYIWGAAEGATRLGINELIRTCER